MFEDFTEEDWLTLANLYADYVVGCFVEQDAPNTVLSPREYFVRGYGSLTSMREYMENRDEVDL